MASVLVTVGCIDDFDGSDDDDDDDASCISLCNDAKDCPESDPTIDCFDECAQSEDMLRDAGCLDAWNRIIDCYGRLDDICDSEAASVVCEEELEDYVVCLEL